MSESYEERYRNLFESIDAGVCVIELIYDEAGRPVDYRFLEVNPAFERQTGLKDATRKTMREHVPITSSTGSRSTGASPRPGGRSASCSPRRR